MASLDEKRKTAANTQAEIKDAKVIANYGDPGLDEDYHFDILSRYVVVMLESTDRILTLDKWFQMLAIVKRPPQLWIKTEGGQASDPTTQKRSDSQGNINIGLANGYSVNGIGRINTPYNLGDSIKVKKIPSVSTQSLDLSFFQSDFHIFDQNTYTYNSWHTQGSTIPYIANDPNKVALLQQKTIQPLPDGSWTFNFALNKYQYEACILNANLGNTAAFNIMTNIFAGTFSGGTQVYSAHGGYVYQSLQRLQISACEYEDINIDNKMRVASADCIPLIVTTPDTFPTPKQRAVGTIAYNPSYSPISTN
jgi:hypothetical protein